MAEILKTEIVKSNTVRGSYAVFTVPSRSNPNKTYRVDMTNGRCDCPAWKFARAGADGKRAPCKHLREFGYTENTVVAGLPAKPDYSKSL